MIGAEEAFEQARRLSVLPFYPSGAEADVAIKELVRAVRCADDFAHAKRVTDDLIEQCERCPTPADIRRLIFSTHAEPEPEKPKPEPKNGYSCGFVCKGWGTVGERPNVRWCTCEHARSLRREIPNWLDLCNKMPGGAKNVVPRAFTGKSAPQPEPDKEMARS